jgi:hypothetical protein
MPEVLLPRAGLSLGDAGTVSLALRAPLRDHLWQGPPVRELRARGVAGRSPVRLDFELLREVTALTAIRDKEETLHHALNTSLHAT